MSAQVCTRGCVRTHTHTHTHTHTAAVEKRCAYRFLIPWPRDSRGETGSAGRDQKWNRGRQGVCIKALSTPSGNLGFNLRVRQWEEGDRRDPTPA